MNLFRAFGEPQNPQNPFPPACDSWQEHALSPGEATPAGPFLWKGLFFIVEALNHLRIFRILSPFRNLSNPQTLNPKPKRITPLRQFIYLSTVSTGLKCIQQQTTNNQQPTTNNNHNKKSRTKNRGERRNLVHSSPISLLFLIRDFCFFCR